MTTLTLPGMPTDRLGVIGTRQLVAVQTLDVARLTAHPICHDWSGGAGHVRYRCDL
jgi:hypothetical protein